MSLIAKGDFRSLAKSITLVENELSGSEALLRALKPNPNTRVIGITGPPGAGKSTLVNAFLHKLVARHQKVAVVSVDPSSPFNFGALLGDRIRMSEFYLNPSVFIRSVASRGSLGGLNAHILEILEVLRSSVFDYVIVETVGVGQSEVEIAGIADTTIVVTVPEAGDEVQTMKAGIMEIADIFVVNKGDREQADLFVKNLKLLVHQKSGDWEIPVLKCIASEQIGIDELLEEVERHGKYLKQFSERKIHLLAEKAWQLIQQKRMQDVRRSELYEAISKAVKSGHFHLYEWIDSFLEEKNGKS
ncbi:MAG: methylmalonyl Co-A mutase-associated GTPase MeaB [Chitinophagaceae bacterium]|nr:methylmalonyl Co-A mutase-associated GTPase MeaB [Chitinophagaceae bacterium]